METHIDSEAVAFVNSLRDNIEPLAVVNRRNGQLEKENVETSPSNVEMADTEDIEMSSPQDMPQ